MVAGTLDRFPKLENTVQLVSRVTFLRIRDWQEVELNRFESARLHQLVCQMPLFLAASGIPAVVTRRSPPPVAPQENGVIAGLQVLIDQLLRTTDAWQGGFPSNRLKKDTSR